MDMLDLVLMALFHLRNLGPASGLYRCDFFLVFLLKFLNFLGFLDFEILNHLHLNLLYILSA